jgi:hypothetical protein
MSGEANSTFIAAMCPSPPNVAECDQRCKSNRDERSKLNTHVLPEISP